MKAISDLGVVLITAIVGFGCANPPQPRPNESGASEAYSPPATNDAGFPGDSMRGHIRLQVGSSNLGATLEENEAALAFEAMLPLTMLMTDLHGNEKYADLSRGLPVDPSSPGTIRAGDLMLYGSRTLVVFYETFDTSYRYTRLGRVVDASGLAAALGAGTVTVTFER